MSKNQKTLQQILIEEFGRQSIGQVAIPRHISENLNPAFGLRDYQQSALHFYSQYMNAQFPEKKLQNHQLLFHMATGSGKTLLMAALILDLFERGYRDFLFFVNSTNIIDKTIDNFLNPLSGKYLFNSSIEIDGVPVFVNVVNSFLDSNDNAINLSFTTIQGLHAQLNTPRENALTYQDFTFKPIVLISDEAHHINADTKNKGKGASVHELLSSPTWESTVERIFQANPSNILLEFTATMDLSDEQLAEKYTSKLIFDYPLREFRNDGFSKEVEVLQSDLDISARALQAVLISQLRKKIFLDFEIQAKPVVLFKSKTIAESENFARSFNELIQTLTVDQITNLLSNSNNRYLVLFSKYVETHNISLENFVLEIQEEFSENRCLVVNSKSDSEEKQLIVNSLEDASNNFRIIFAVDKLNEGWDVLNLFDIVRLYDTRDAKDNKVGKTTMSEAQLIGRGARYFPFIASGDQDRYVRKYDSDLEHPLRICETLLYHSSYNPKYLQELNSALQELGIKAKDTVTHKLELKDSFKQSNVYKSGYFFLNERVRRTPGDYPTFSDYVSTRIFKARLSTGWSGTAAIFDSTLKELESIKSQKFDLKISEISSIVVRKALARNKSFRFNSLIRYFPNLATMTEFIESPNFLASLRVEVTSSYANLALVPIELQLEILAQVFEDLSSILFSTDYTYFGSKEFKPVAVESVFRDKLMQFNVDDVGNQEFGVSMSTPGRTAYHLDLSVRDWFAYEDFFGTSEEKLLIHYLDKQIEKLAEIYRNIYILRNEKFFKIFNFADGAATEPDFVLFLEARESAENKFYQVFIEPKGQHLVANDQWKEDLLISLKDEALVSQLILGADYRIIGMPFYNHNLEGEFDSRLHEILG